MSCHFIDTRIYYRQTRPAPLNALDRLPAGIIPIAPLALHRETHRCLAPGHRQEHLGQNFRIEQCAVQSAFGIIDKITITQRVQAVSFAREQFARHDQAVCYATDGIGFTQATIKLAELVVHKADIKGGVVNNQFRTTDKFQEFIGYLCEARFIRQEFIADAVDVIGFRVNQPVRVKVDVKMTAGQPAVDHLDSTDFNDPVTLIVNPKFIHTRGFGIENNLSCNSGAHHGVLCQTWLFKHKGSLPEMQKQVVIFTDGSCLGNPGPGGYGAILRYKDIEKEFSAGYYLTTNNRMELMAAIVALEALKGPCEVVLSTDSQYVRQGITQWIHNWKKRGWRTADKKPVKNVDLWQRLDTAIQGHQLRWDWVKGHAGHPENERCDVLAKAAATHPAFEDTGYQPEK